MKRLSLSCVCLAGSLAILLSWTDGTAGAVDWGTSPGPARPATGLVGTPVQAGAPQGAAAPSPSESWPQPFRLASGEKAEFGFAVGQAGQVSVEVRWQGAPLTVTLKDPSGKPVHAASPQPGPAARVSYEVGPADLRKGLIWTVAVGAPPTPAPAKAPAGGIEKPAAEGQLSVSHPPADRAAVEAQAQAMAARQRAEFNARAATGAAAFRAGAQTKIDALAKARKDRIEIQRKQLLPSGTAIGAAKAPGAGIAPVLPAGGPAVLKTPGASGAVPEIPGAVRRPPTLAGSAQEPMIWDVTPGTGFPGDTVAIEGSGLRPDINWVEAYFKIDAGPHARARVLSAAKIPDGARLEVRVPNKSGVLPAYDGEVYLLATDVGKKTNALPFRFEPVPAPTIVRVYPETVKPGEQITLWGNNFRDTQEVRFLLDGGRDVLGQKVFHSDTQFAAQVPAYTSAVPFPGGVYVASGPKIGNRKALMFEPTAPCYAEAVSPASGDVNSPLQVLGYNLDKGCEVTFAGGSGAKVVARSQPMDAHRMQAWVPNAGYGEQIVDARPAGATPPVAKGKRGAPFYVNPPGPVVEALTPAEGEPDMYVLISGAAFFQPEVHFVIQPGRDVVATIVQQTGDRQILAAVPKATGIAAPYDGQVYVKSGNKASAPKPFRFLPATSYQFLELSGTLTESEIRIQSPALIPQPFCIVPDTSTWSYYSCSHTAGFLFGAGGDDAFFPNFRLKNGWVVEQINFGRIAKAGEADALIVEDRRGTDSPYFKVHWWVTPAMDSVEYYFSILLRGPEGVPYR